MLSVSPVMRSRRIRTVSAVIIVTASVSVLIWANRPTITNFDSRFNILECKVSHGTMHSMFIGGSQIEGRLRESLNPIMRRFGVQVTTFDRAVSEYPSKSYTFLVRLTGDNYAEEPPALKAELTDRMGRRAVLEGGISTRYQYLGESVGQWSLKSIPEGFVTRKLELRLTTETNAVAIVKIAHL